MKKTKPKPQLRFCPFCRSLLSKKVIEGYRRLVCIKCGWVYYNNPLPVVSALARNKRGEIFLARRNIAPGKGRWALPGGFIESTETPEDACVRELYEETGMIGKVKNLIGIYTQDTRYYNRLLVIGYEVYVASDHFCLNHELREGGFFRRKDLPPIPFISHRNIVRDFFK